MKREAHAQGSPSAERDYTYGDRPSSALHDLQGLIAPARVVAAERLAAAKARKLRNVALMSKERENLAHGAVMDFLERWTHTLEADSKDVQHAERFAARIDQIVQQASGAVELQEAALEQQNEIRRQSKSLQDAKQRLQAAQSMVRTLEVEASDERTRLVGLGTWAEMEKAARKFAAQQSAAIAEAAAAPPSEEKAARARRGSDPPAPRPPPRRHIRGLDALDDSPGEKEVRGPSGKVYAGKSFFTLLPGEEPRRSFILFAESSFFDPFILLTIMVNCLTMAWESPLDPEGTPKAQ